MNRFDATVAACLQTIKMLIESFELARKLARKLAFEIQIHDSGRSNKRINNLGVVDPIR